MEKERCDRENRYNMIYLYNDKVITYEEMIELENNQ